MGGGNLQKSQMARERHAKDAAKQGQGGGGADGMKKRQADAGSSGDDVSVNHDETTKRLRKT